jgi:CRP-like cAMP-binding protein
MNIRNRLLAGLPDDEMSRLTPHVQLVQLPLGRVVYDPEEHIDAVYFPEDGIISLLSVMSDGSAVETATVGNDGMAGMAVFHGVDCVAEQAYVQVAGEGYRIGSQAFRAVLPSCPVLIAALHRYAVALFTQAAQTSGCNRKHTIEQRCARWLLMVHDRVTGDEFELTQLVLSQMLGVRRATVTEAAGELQRAGHIRYSRGRITIVDRAGLEAAVCECYGIIRSTFDRLIGDESTPSPLVGVRVSEGGQTTARDGAPMAGDTDE